MADALGGRVLKWSPYRSLLELSNANAYPPLDGLVYDFVFRVEKEFPKELKLIANIYPQHVHAIHLLRLGGESLHEKAKAMGDYDDD